MCVMTVAENIKTIRKEKGLTQKQLAELIGVSERSIQQFEYGQITPKYETRLKLTKVLNYPFVNQEVIYIPLDITKVSTKDLLKELERRCSK